MTIRVLLADDQPLIRAGYKMILESEPDIEIVGEAVDGREAVDLARSARADIVLMDIRMPAMDDNVMLALRAGASGFLGKNVGPEELINAVRVVAAGDGMLSPKAVRGLLSHLRAQPDVPAVTTVPIDVLTDREREVLVLAAHGLSNEAIGERLFLSPLTAKTHINRAMTKLRVRDRSQLVVVAYQSGLARPGTIAQ
jgi:DNA-binding NarL/FixJ family response regulator